MSTIATQSNTGFFVYGLDTTHHGGRRASNSPPGSPPHQISSLPSPRPMSATSSILRTVTNYYKQVLPPKPALPKPTTPIAPLASRAPIKTVVNPKPQPTSATRIPRMPQLPVASAPSMPIAQNTRPTILATCSPARAPILRDPSRTSYVKKTVRWASDVVGPKEVAMFEDIQSLPASPIFDSPPISPTSSLTATPEPEETEMLHIRSSSTSIEAARKSEEVLENTTSSKQLRYSQPLPRIAFLTTQAPTPFEPPRALLDKLSTAPATAQTVVTATENTPFGPRRVRRVVVPAHADKPASANPDIQRELAALRTQSRVRAPESIPPSARETGFSLRALETINRVRRQQGLGELKTVPRRRVATPA